MSAPRPHELQPAAGPRAGRLVLLFAAYAPVAVIVGLRALPGWPAWAILGLGLAGVLLWIAFLWWLPGRQQREALIKDAEYIDSEVTAYIVSILLPVVAASQPAVSDWAAYAVCGTLILVVAYAAELWSVNPITYLFRLRAARAIVEGEARVVLVRGPLGGNSVRPVIKRVGVMLVLEPEEGERDVS